jgi:WD40 repeat protein
VSGVITRTGVARLLIAAALLSSACRQQPEDSSPAGVREARRVQFDPADPGRLLVVEREGDVDLWRVEDPKHPRAERRIAAHATDARFLPAGQGVVTAGTDGRVRRFLLDGSPVWATSEKHAGPIRGLAVGPDLIASAGEDGGVRLWTFAGTPAGTLDTGGGMVLAVAFAPDGTRLAAETADTRLRLWQRDGATGVYTPALTFRDVNKRYVKLLPNLVRYDVGWGWDRSLAFAPDGSALAAADFRGKVRRWSPTGTPIGEPLPSLSKQHIRAIAVAPDGRLAAAVYDGTVQIWPADGGAPAAFKVGEGITTAVAFAPDGKRLATAGIDGAVNLWNPDGERAGALPAAK